MMSLPPLLNLALLLYMFVVLAATTLWFALTLRRAKRKQVNADRQRNSQKSNSQQSSNQKTSQHANGQGSNRHDGKPVTRRGAASKLSSKTVPKTVSKPAMKRSATEQAPRANQIRASRASTEQTPASQRRRSADTAPTAQQKAPSNVNANTRDATSREAKRARMKARASLRQRSPLHDVQDTTDKSTINKNTVNKNTADKVTPDKNTASTAAESMPVSSTASPQASTSLPAPSETPAPSESDQKRRIAPPRAGKLVPSVQPSPLRAPNALRPAPTHSSPRPSQHDPWPRVIPPAQPTPPHQPENTESASRSETLPDTASDSNSDSNNDAFGAFEDWLDKNDGGF